MTQTRALDYGAPRRSQVLNERLVGVIPSGIYSGYEVVPTSPLSLSLTISAGKLITADGVSIVEDASLVAEVTITPHDTLPRIDAIFATHAYSTSNVPQSYSVVEGTPGTPPIPPAAPADSIKLAEVYVPAAATEITSDLIQNATKVNADSSLLARTNISELRVEPASESSSGLSDKAFVHGGLITNSAGSGAVTVLDQETASFSPIASGAGYERWDLVTVDDNGDVGIIEGYEDIGSGAAVPPSYPNDKQVVAEVHITEQGTASDPVLIQSDDIRDVRFFFNLPLGGIASAKDRDDWVSTTGQTVIDLSFSYTPGQNQITFSYGGVILSVTSDYTETSGTRVTTTFPLRSGVNCSIWRDRVEAGSS